jgi:nucleotide-binding universal stress UspA family protein
MVECVVVATDGSKGAAKAVAWGAEAAGALGAKAVAVSVVDPHMPHTESGSVEEERAYVRDRLEEDWAQPLAGLPDRRVLVGEGDARTVLLDMCALEDADLLVLGSTGAGWFPALHLGHAAHYVAHHTDRPVAIVPMDNAPLGLGRVVIGVDGSSGSRAAVEFACQLGAAGCEGFTAVHAYLPRAEGGVRRDPADWRQETERSCREWAHPLEGSGPILRTVVEEGEPSRVIANTARTEEASLVVVGTRGRGALRGLRLGSVALRLLQHSDRPVVLVPPRD